MAVAELRRLFGIDPENNIWMTMISGAPNAGSGYVLGIGSIAEQVDSQPTGGVRWYKFGPNPTDWTNVFFDPSVRTITISDLPTSVTQPVETSVAQLIDPFLMNSLDRGSLATGIAGAGLPGETFTPLRDGTPDDFLFALKAAVLS